MGHPWKGATTGDGVIDIGANAGEWASQFGNAVGPTGRVLAVEPDPRAVAVCRQKCAAYPWVTIMEAAVLDTMKPATLYTSHDSAQNSCWLANCLSDAGSLETHAVTLDFLASLVPNLAVIKIDAQGAEPYILDGGQATLARPGLTWYVELWRTGCANAGRDVVADVIDVFKAHGLEPEGRTWDDVTERVLRQDGHSAEDVVLARREAHAHV